MNVVVSREFLMPQRCACCLAPADTHLVARHEKMVFLIIVTIRRTATLEVPYCRQCRDHVSGTGGWWIFFKSLGVLFAGFFVQWPLFAASAWLGSFSLLTVVSRSSTS